MDFPEYVPAAVRDYITARLEGDSWEPQGWVASLENAERQLDEIKSKMETAKESGENDDYLGALRIQDRKAQAHRDALAGTVDCLQRLANDERMRKVYDWLAKKKFTDEQQRDFIASAWIAAQEFSRYREQRKIAQQLAGDIAKTAEKLVTLICRFADTGIDNAPCELYSIPELLRQTDGNEMWQAMRHLVTGDRPRWDISEAQPEGKDGEPPPPLEIVRHVIKPGEKPEIDPRDSARNMVCYAWENAPDFSALIGTMAEAARRFGNGNAVHVFGTVNAATATRQHNKKTDYLRAVLHKLRECHFPLTSDCAPAAPAVATVANVVLNDDKHDVTADDVRKQFHK